MAENDEPRFKACITSLHVVGQRLIQSNFILDTISEKQKNRPPVFVSTEEQEAIEKNKEFWFDTISVNNAFDRIIVNLFSLIEIHQDLLPFLKTKNLLSLEKALEDVWKVVERNKNRIGKWRNNITAHGKSFAPDGTFLTIPDIEKKVVEAQREIYLASKCAVMYVEGIVRNVKEHQDAIKELQKKIGDMPSISHKDYLDIDKQANEVQKVVIDKLKNAGFNSEIYLRLRFE